MQDFETEEAEKKRKEAWRLCESIARVRIFLDLLCEDLKAMGVVREATPCKCIYLALCSRFLAEPVCVIVKGTSSSGKSFVLKNVLKLFPENAYYKLTSSSEKALVYSNESFEHRFLIYFEEEGINGDFQDMIIRTLISEKEIRYPTS